MTNLKQQNSKHKPQANFHVGENITNDRIDETTYFPYNELQGKKLIFSSMEQELAKNKI